jgi:hypothetical protein
MAVRYGGGLVRYGGGLVRRGGGPVPVRCGGLVSLRRAGRGPDTAGDHPQRRGRPSGNHPQRPQRPDDPTAPVPRGWVAVAGRSVAGRVAAVGGTPPGWVSAAGGTVAELVAVGAGRFGAGASAGQAPEGSLVAGWRAAPPAHEGRRHGPVRPPAPPGGAPWTPPARRRWTGSPSRAGRPRRSGGHRPASPRCRGRSPWGRPPGPTTARCRP